MHKIHKLRKVAQKIRKDNADYAEIMQIVVQKVSKFTHLFLGIVHINNLIYAKISKLRINKADCAKHSVGMCTPSMLVTLKHYSRPSVIYSVYARNFHQEGPFNQANEPHSIFSKNLTS